MFMLVDRKTGRIVQQSDKDFDHFLENEWGGLFPFVKDGMLHTTYGTISGCLRYDKFWISQEELNNLKRFAMTRVDD